MSTVVSDDMKLPGNRSSYYDYPYGIPVGATMDFSLSGEPPGTLAEDVERHLFFVATKVADDGWQNVKNEKGIVRNETCMNTFDAFSRRERSGSERLDSYKPVYVSFQQSEKLRGSPSIISRS